MENKKIVTSAYDEQASLVIAAFSNLAEKIINIEQKHKQTRKLSKARFNFFYALVYKNTHFEKYHSNFIRYLLNPNEEHDCESLFLRYFLEFIQVKISGLNGTHSRLNFINSWLQSEDLLTIEINPEKQISNGRVDIEILNKKGTKAIFIENKIRSQEGNRQMLDYIEHYQKKYIDQFLGIYLTKNGFLPESIKKDETTCNTVVPLSYRDIIELLKECIKDKEIKECRQITFAIEQYIQELKKELSMLEDIEIKDLQEYFAVNTKELLLLAKCQSKMNDALNGAIKPFRDAFQRQLVETLQEQLKVHLAAYTFKVNEDEPKCYIDVFLKGKLKLKIYIDQAYPQSENSGRGLWWGIYNDNDKPFGFAIGLQQGCWEGVLVEGIDDFRCDDLGSAKIIEWQLNPEKRPQAITEIVQNIMSKIKSMVIPALQSKKIL